MHAHKNFDPTYYGLSLLAPKNHVPKIWALLALKAELDSVINKVTDPQMGYIRLKWWQEALQELPQTAHQHPILSALASFSTPQLNQLLADMAAHTAEKLAPLNDWAALQRWANADIWQTWQAWCVVCHMPLPDNSFKPLAQVTALTRLLRHNLGGPLWLPQTLLANATLAEALKNYSQLLEGEWQRAHANTPKDMIPFIYDAWVQRTWFERFKKAAYQPTRYNSANPPLWLWRCWLKTKL